MLEIVKLFVKFVSKLEKSRILVFAGLTVGLMHKKVLVIEFSSISYYYRERY